MKYSVLRLALVVGICGNNLVWSQTRVDLRTQAKNIDFANASSTRPFKVGTVLPSTCLVGEMFFKSDAPAGSNIYACTETDIWTVDSQGPQAGLPDASGSTGAILTQGETGPTWKSVVGGATGAMQVSQGPGEISIDIVSEIIPRKPAANVFTGLNTFDLGIQIVPQPAPLFPADGRIWYDSVEHKFKAQENGVTVDFRGGSGGGAAAGASFITKTPDPTLTNSQALSSLNTGLLKNTTGTGSLSIALAGTDYYAPGTAIQAGDLPQTVPQISAWNIFTGLNTFDLGIQMTPQIAPASPVNGRIWYDSTQQKFKAQENGATVDLRSTSTGGASTAASFITKTPDATLTNSQALSSLNTGLLKNTTGTGNLAVAAAGTDYYAPGTAIQANDLPSSVAQKSVSNIFTSLNTFDLGIQMTPQIAPASPGNGRIWYDSTQQKFKAQENGVTVDLRSTSTGGASTATSFITKTPDSTLANSQALSSLNTGLLKNTTGTGDLAVAAAGTDYYAPGTAIQSGDLPQTVPQKSTENTFTNLNKFDVGIQMMPQTAPAAPENGHIWYDSTQNKFKAQENGMTVDLRSGSGGGGDLPTVENVVITNAYMVAATNNHAPNGVIRVHAVTVPVKTTINKGWVYVATPSSGATVFFGLYDSNRNAVCRASATSPTSSGLVTGDCVEGTVTVLPGVYYLAATTSNSTLSLLGTTTSTPVSQMLNGGAKSMVSTASTISGGSLPNQLSTLSDANNGILVSFGK